MDSNTNNLPQAVERPALRSGDLLGVSVCDGKYTIQADGDGRLRALRYGEPWRDLTGDGMVLALVQEIERLRADLANAYQKAAAIDYDLRKLGRSTDSLCCDLNPNKDSSA